MNRIILKITILIIFFTGCLPSIIQPVEAAPLMEVGAQDLINLINGMRVAQGLPALTVNNILMATAQETSDIMAINDLHAHIGDVRGRVMAAGYGGGAIAWATENFAIGPMTIDQIQQVWADPDHMIPVVNANYKDIGAGVTTMNGRVWYIIHAAYVSGGTYVQNTPIPGSTAEYSTPAVSQIIIPVHTTTPNQEGAVVHDVQSGQALWSIAIAYGTKIEELVRLNNLSSKDPIIYVGQKLLIFEAKFTPTPTFAGTFNSDEQKLTATPKVTATPTATKTKTARPTTAVISSPTPTQIPPNSSTKVFKNPTIGIVLVSALAFGILLIISGSLSKIKK
jgi:LysM repeat protein